MSLWAARPRFYSTNPFYYLHRSLYQTRRLDFRPHYIRFETPPFWLVWLESSFQKRKASRVGLRILSGLLILLRRVGFVLWLLHFVVSGVLLRNGSWLVPLRSTINLIYYNKGKIFFLKTILIITSCNSHLILFFRSSITIIAILLLQQTY